MRLNSANGYKLLHVLVHMHWVCSKVMSFWQGECVGKAFWWFVRAGKFLKTGLSAQPQTTLIESNVYDYALLRNRCVFAQDVTSSSTPPACFLISLQEGSSADSDSVPQKVIYSHPVYYKHHAAACLSSLHFAFL